MGIEVSQPTVGRGNALVGLSVGEAGRWMDGSADLMGQVQDATASWSFSCYCPAPGFMALLLHYLDHGRKAGPSKLV